MPGKKGFGAKLEYLFTTGPDVYVEIANIQRVRPFSMKTDMVDVTSMDSVAEFREKLSSISDAGQCQVDVNYDDKATSHKWMQDNLGLAKTFKFTGPGSSPRTATFSGFVSAVSPEVPYDSKMSCSVTIEITSVITFA